ncbi:MAG: pyruvate kinase [Oscillatoriales cyanobacterium SM2_3_0]|nr:pyruvate kinase [Oscillatoriales cyanobacterium SM2_3_0]
MQPLKQRTKIVATIGPASRDPEILKQMIRAGMNVARLNFSHGSYEDHAETIKLLRQVSQEMDAAITLLQDLQGPKIRVGQLPDDSIELVPGELITFVPMDEYSGQPHTAAIDYPHLAEEAEPGAQILLDDGLLEVRIEAISSNSVQCKIIEGGTLKSRKGVNLPSLILQLPSMTEKDKQDLEFGLSQEVDWVSLSFVRRPEDVQALKAFMAKRGAEKTPVMAKIEKPQAVANLQGIIDECDGLMVARGDLGVELSPEKVPLIQKQIIRLCNQKGIPVITATQMLESMIHNPRPTRAEASDVANAILDGTDAVMLSGESAVGDYPVRAVEMLARIAMDVEPEAKFINYPPADSDETHALSEAINTIDKILDLKGIVAFTSTGYTAELAAEERPRAPVFALTPERRTYHRLNLVWGVRPLLIDHEVEAFEDLLDQAETLLVNRNLLAVGDQILIVAGIPTKHPRGTNFLKIHQIRG